MYSTLAIVALLLLGIPLLWKLLGRVGLLVPHVSQLFFSGSLGIFRPMIFFGKLLAVAVGALLLFSPEASKVLSNGHMSYISIFLVASAAVALLLSFSKVFKEGVALIFWAGLVVLLVNRIFPAQVASVSEEPVKQRATLVDVQSQVDEPGLIRTSFGKTNLDELQKFVFVPPKSKTANSGSQTVASNSFSFDFPFRAEMKTVEDKVGDYLSQGWQTKRDGGLGNEAYFGKPVEKRRHYGFDDEDSSGGLQSGIMGVISRFLK